MRNDDGDAWWNGDSWRWGLTSGMLAPTIHIIEAPEESYEAFHERKKREEEAGGAKPFGFARALTEPEPPKPKGRKKAAKKK